MKPFRICGHWIPADTVLGAMFDLVLLPLSLLLAVAWLTRGDPRSLLIAVPFALLAGLAMLFGHACLGGRRGPRALGITSAELAGWLLLAAPVAYGMVPRVIGEREGLVVFLLIGFLVAVRGYAMSEAFDGLLRRRILVLGTGVAAAELLAAAEDLDSGARFAGFYPVHEGGEVAVTHERVMAAEPGLTATARGLAVDEIVVALHDRRASGLPGDALLECRLAGVQVVDLPDYFERTLRQVRLDSRRGSWLVFGEGFRQGWARMATKRLFDIVTAGLLLALMWPLMLLSAALIVLASGRPVFYKQQRVGQNDRVFDMIKFRSMCVDAESDGTPRWAARGDARVTRVGRILRRLRIDELPQLWNVLLGDMSLVGPRPERPYFVAQLGPELPFYAVRHRVKPGLTGWAQVRYRYGDSAEDAAHKLRYDLYYVKNHSLFLDTLILFETVRVVLTGAGAR